jgi:VWFA-related protein
VVTGLGSADFKVEISGKPREIVSVEHVEYSSPSSSSDVADPGAADITTNQPSENGRVVLLVIDRGSLGSDTRSIIDSARKWVLAMPPRDSIGLLTFPAPGPSVDFTVDHAKVAEALTRVVGVGTQMPPFQQYNISIWEAIRMESQDLFVRNDVVGRECRASQPLCPTEIDMQVKTMVIDAQSHVQPVLRSLRSTMRGLAAVPGPKHVVLLSSGWAMNERDASTEMGWVAADAARANVTVHTFTAEMWALAATRSRPSMRSVEDRTLLMNNVEMLAGMTGGRSVRLSGQADTAFASLSAGLSGYYRLGVHALPEDLDGKDHRISLKVSRPGAQLASYRRVMSGTLAKDATPKDPETALRDAVKGGPPQTGVDLRATSYVLHATTSPRDLRVVVVGDVNRAAAGKATAVAALYEMDGKPATAMENAVQIAADGAGAVSIELTAPPGAYVLRLAVRDAEGRIGSLERLVDARWKKTGGIETPGLVLFRSARGGGQRPVFDGLSTADELIAQVALSGPVVERKTQVAFEITRVGSSAPLVRRAGRILQTTGGTTVAHETLPVSMLPPGRYTMSAKISGGNTALTRTFTVTADPGGPAAMAATTAAVGTSGAAVSAPGTASSARRGVAPGGASLAFAKPRFSTSTVLAADFVTPLIDRLAARPDASDVRDALERAKAGPWPTDSAKGPLASAPLAAHFVAGLGRLQAGDLEEAAGSFRAALRVAPDFAPALIYLGACYAAGAKDQEAAGAWQMALVRERMSPDLQRLAIEAWLRADKPAAALALLNQARQRFPEDATFVRLQAQAALAAGRHQEGLDLVAALEQPDPPTLLLALTTLYDAARHETPVWDVARDLETMRRLRETYAAMQGESLPLVDAWIAEITKGQAGAPPR